MLQYFDSIMLNDAQVSQFEFFNLIQQTAHARRMHFDGQIIILRMAVSDGSGTFPHAEADFQYFRR